MAIFLFDQSKEKRTVSCLKHTYCKIEIIIFFGDKKGAEIVLIDHGLYDFINETDRKNLCKLWIAIILKNEDKMKYYSAKLNVPGKSRNNKYVWFKCEVWKKN